MKRIRSIIFLFIIVTSSVNIMAQHYIDPLIVEAGEGFDITVVSISGTMPFEITNAFLTVSGTNITIEVSALKGGNNALDADIVTLPIPPLFEGTDNITTFINGFAYPTKQFSIPYEGFWLPDEIDHWNKAMRYSWDYIGDPVAPDLFFSNPTNLYAYALGGNQVNDPNIIIPTFTQIGNVIEYTHPRRNDDDNIIYQLLSGTNLTMEIWTTGLYMPVETNAISEICDEFKYSIPATNSQEYFRLKALYQY